MSSKIYIVGMGPGTGEMMTPQADHALCGSDVIVGYPVYLKLLGGKYRKKEFLSTPMKQEVRRCEMCFEEAEKGKTVAMVCSGDAGVYGMASLLYEMSEAHPGCELEVIPGITAANSGAAALGAPLNHDYCVISLSDLMTPWEIIEKRLAAAAVGAMTMAAGIMVFIIHPATTGQIISRRPVTFYKKTEWSRREPVAMWKTSEEKTQPVKSAHSQNCGSVR